MVTKQDLDKAYRLARIIAQTGALEWAKLMGTRASQYINQEVPSIPRVLAASLYFHISQPEEWYSLQQYRQIAKDTYDYSKSFEQYKDCCKSVWRLKGHLPK